ncbi:hypothetical protein NIES2111_16070 [Nostoc sp. NIES-2111]|nr:hypothetical protein NIES2111_16070 [Nostoc sp. NIES-2111]
MAQDKWTIRNVSEDVQREVRVLAAAENISIAEALERIVSEWKHLKALDKAGKLGDNTKAD